MRDSGHQVVGHVLVVTLVASGTLVVARLADLASTGIEHLLTALATFS